MPSHRQRPPAKRRSRHRQGEYLPDAGVPARGEVAVRLSREARVFVHHGFGRWDEGCFELGSQQKSEQQLGEASDGESELTWHNQTPHGVRVSNRALCQDSPRLQATGPGEETAEARRVDGRHAEKAEIQTREAEVHHRVTPEERGGGGRRVQAAERFSVFSETRPDK